MLNVHTYQETDYDIDDVAIIDGVQVRYADMPYRDLILLAKKDARPDISPKAVGCYEFEYKLFNVLENTYSTPYFKGLDLFPQKPIVIKGEDFFCATCDTNHDRNMKVDGIWGIQLYGIFEVRLGTTRYAAEKIMLNAYKMRYIKWHDLRWPSGCQGKNEGVVEFLI